ncbi:shootin-1-like [Daktulosphaira vitifoliae]|uniref:shootin-1-like n=1 Tax=Daktulosphaira vitifoliae TaxID=58002 RepID=UPI0021AA5403|nr:shootin-1-like [Daktulosphaira vitifoliae]
MKRNKNTKDKISIPNSKETQKTKQFSELKLNEENNLTTVSTDGIFDKQLSNPSLPTQIFRPEKEDEIKNTMKNGDTTSQRLTELEEVVHSLKLEVVQLNKVSCYVGKKTIKKSEGKKGYNIFYLNSQRMMKLEDDFQFIKSELIELKKSFNNFVQKNATKVIIPPPPPPPPPPPFPFTPRSPLMHKGDGDCLRLQNGADIKSKKMLKPRNMQNDNLIKELKNGVVLKKVKRLEITKPPEDDSELAKIFSKRRIKDTGQL